MFKNVSISTHRNVHNSIGANSITKRFTQVLLINNLICTQIFLEFKKISCEEQHMCNFGQTKNLHKILLKYHV